MQAKFLLTAIAAVFTLSSHAQSLEKMQWFNEPESYTIKGGTLELARVSFTEDSTKASPSSFFLFVAHIVFLYQLQRWSYALLDPVTQLGNILYYWSFITFYIAILTASYFLFNRFLPHTMSILTGGRYNQMRNITK